MLTCQVMSLRLLDGRSQISGMDPLMAQDFTPPKDCLAEFYLPLPKASICLQWILACLPNSVGLNFGKGRENGFLPMAAPVFLRSGELMSCLLTMEPPLMDGRNCLKMGK